MHMKKSNTNRPNTTTNRGKIAAIAGLTLTCGMILSDVAPVMAATGNNNIEISTFTEPKSSEGIQKSTKQPTNVKHLATNIDGVFATGTIKDYKYGETATITVNPVDGYTIDKGSDTITASVGIDGALSIYPLKKVNLTPKSFAGKDIKHLATNIDGVFATGTIKDYKYGETATITVNPVDGYTIDKGSDTITASVGIDGTLSIYPLKKVSLTPKSSSTSGNDNNTGESAHHKKPSAVNNAKDTIRKIIHKLTTLFHHRHIKLYNRDFKESADRSLSAGSDWYSDQTIEHNGKTYYRVSKNEYVAAEDIYSYEDKDVVVSTKADSDKDLVNSQGKMSNRRLAKGTPWKSDRTIKINGKTYYRVSTDEFVSADDVIVR